MNDQAHPNQPAQPRVEPAPPPEVSAAPLTSAFPEVPSALTSREALSDAQTLKPSLVQRGLPWLCLLLCLASLAWSYNLQGRLRSSEEELTRRQNDGLQQLVETRTVSKQAEATARDMVGRLSLLEARVAETALQRGQLEDLMQSMSRSQDETVLADVGSALRVAQQQAALTGSIEPLVSTLKQAEERLSRVQQPRLERVRRAVLQDLDRVRAVGHVDLTTLTLRLDEVARQIDELPLVSASSAAAAAEAPAKPSAGKAAPVGAAASAAQSPDWTSRAQGLLNHVWLEARQLVRVTRIDQPEAALLAPEQAVFLRESLRMRLLGARLSLLSRQFDVAQSDMRQAQALLDKYFDRSSRRVLAASEILKQTSLQAKAIDVPKPTASLAAIATATAGR